MKRIATLFFVFIGLTLPLAGIAQAKRPSKEQTKVNTYVTLLNQWSPYMRKTQASYLKWVDAKIGPTCKERGIRPMGALGSSAEATFKGIGKTLRKGPKLPADKAALAMVSALQAFHSPVKAAGEYYRSEYRKDDCKKGKSLHPQLMSAWSSYFAGELAVRSFVVSYNDKLSVAELAKTKKKYGLKIRYHFQKLKMDGKGLVRIVDQELRSPSPDLSAIQGALDAYLDIQKAANELYVVERTKKRSKIASVLYQGGYSQYCSYARNFGDSVKKLITTISAKSKSRMDRDRKSVFDTYNRMVDQGNSVGFSKRVK